MAEFCEGCPNAGDCKGPIVELKVLSSVTQGSISEDRRSASLSLEYGIPQGPTEMTVLYIEANGGSSEPIKVYGNSGSDAEKRLSIL